ncbi:MAG: glycosyltransferase family 4 protein [Clostridia bacterium]|nr:glycosyltransferase family 4 protein [Clostridia bacterium]
MKKVLIVASVVSFIEWFNKENVDFLKKDLGCDVHIACNFDYVEDTDSERTIHYIEKLRADGIVIHNIHFNRSPLSIKNISAYKQLKKIINENNFDLIHCHTPAASMMTRLAAKKARKKGSVVMYTCHGFHFHNASPKKNWLIYYPIEKHLSRHCDYIVTINKEDFNRTQKFHTKNTRYIPSVGVDINRIKNVQIDKQAYKESIGLPRDAIMLLSIGEMIDRKNHEVIIKALGKLQRKDIYYVICGKGPLKEYLENLAKKYEIFENVIFLGFRKDIPELCNSADISAFPSKIEGLGLAGIEAMAAGVPLVSSNVHGILDYVIDGKTGYALSPKDVKGFAFAIEKLASNKELRESMKEACLKAVEPFELSNALKVMQDIYLEILQNERIKNETL